MATREFHEFIKANERLSAKTISNYQHSYFKMADGLDKTIAESNQKDIIEYIYSMTENPNSRVQHINVAILVRRHNNASVDKLVNTRMRLKLKIEEHKDVVNARKKEELPCMIELTRHLNTLYTEGKWRDVIIIYLLMTYNTRNKDLDLAIVSGKKHAWHRTRCELPDSSQERFGVFTPELQDQIHLRDQATCVPHRQN